MEIFEERYFNFNRKLFVFMGLWPFGSKMRNIRKYLYLSALALMFMPPLFSVKMHFSDIDRVLLNFVIFFIAFLMFFKVLAMIIAEHKMKALYRKIADNWMTITDEKEKEILIKFSELGRKKAILYFVIMNAGASSVFVLPMIPKVLDIISPSPNPRPTIYILENELFIDRDTYYWIYYFWDAIVTITNAIANVAVDTMFIICVEHCCALYAIIRYRLQNLKPTTIDPSTGTRVDLYNYVIGILKLHRDTVKYEKFSDNVTSKQFGTFFHIIFFLSRITETVNEAFSLIFLYVLIANMACIPLCAVTVISTFDEPLNCIRFGALLVLFGIHLFMLFLPGQNILDHSTNLIDDAYCNEWYETPLHIRKIIIIFMLRCSRPEMLVAGRLMLMNFETFSMIVRTALSYITVVASFR